MRSQAAQIAAHIGVERTKRFVEQQHARIDGERAGKRHALTLTAGNLAGETVLQTAQLHEVEQFLDPFGNAPAACA